MAEEEKNSGERGATEQAAADNFMNSINMAFNLGVSANQATGQTKSVAEIADELGKQIYQNFMQGYGGEVNESFLKANTEYFLQISLMGYIIPSVCAFDNDFKERLFELIYRRAKQNQGKAAGGGDEPPGGRIIT